MDFAKPMLAKRFQLQAVSAMMALALTGCGSVQFRETRISQVDLNFYQINCDDREAQEQFLRTQLDINRQSGDMMYRAVAMRKLESLKGCPR